MREKGYCSIAIPWEVIEKCEFSVLFPKTPKFANVDCVYISPYLHTMQVLVW